MKILGIGRIPTPVNESEIASILHIMDSGLQAEPHPYVAAGEMVQIECGPLQGLTGIVVRLKGSERLVVSVSLLMRSVAVELDQTSVRPLHDAFPALRNVQQNGLRVAPVCETAFQPARRPPSLITQKESVIAITKFN
jgi:hypothetical protein